MQTGLSFAVELFLQSPCPSGCAPIMQTETHFSWLREVVVPIIFILFGSALGFFASQVGEDRKAKKAKESFMRAIRMELEALGDQLDASLHEVRASTQRVSGGGNGPKFAAALRISVFSSQIGKVRDVDDPLIMEIIHFYSDLGTLQQIFESVNELGAEYNRASVPFSDRAGVISALTVLDEQISGFGIRLRKLKNKLRQATEPTSRHAR